MNDAARLAHRFGVPFAILLIATSLLLGGCAGKKKTMYADDGYGGVSAREYGYVRPATDVWMLGENGQPRSKGQAGSGADLWARVRTGMKLDRYASARIDRKVEAFRRDPQYLTKLSQRARPYLHVIVDEIERRGLPAELALLPHVESRYNPAATSHAAAAGMWQFIPSTGRIMGLEQDGYYDGRRDILASTRAALDYLEQLHRRLGGNWELAMAAYNCGPGRVESAQAANRRRGRPTDFWSLNLPNETKNYVPQILAASRLVSEPAKYGMRLPPIPSTPQLEVVHSTKPLDLNRVAQVSGVRIDELRRLNAGLKLGRTIPGGPSQVVVPAGKGKRVSAKLGKARVLPAVASTARLRKPASRGLANLPTARAMTASGGRIHVVRAGETLRSIARANKIDPQALAEFNAMRVRDPLLPGQSLRIPSKAESGNSGVFLSHRVQKGDSLGTIARRYGVAIEDVQRWNPVASRELKSGESIRIYRRNNGPIS